MTTKKSSKNSKSKTTVRPSSDATTWPERGWKSDFIRKCSEDTPASEVVALAKRAGFDITANYVYSVRTEMRQKRTAQVVSKKKVKVETEAALAPATPAAATSAAVLSKVGKTVADNVSPMLRAAFDTSAVRTVELLKAIASEIGLGDAIAILQAERARVLCLLRPASGSDG